MRDAGCDCVDQPNPVREVEPDPRRPTGGVRWGSGSSRCRGLIAGFVEGLIEGLRGARVTRGAQRIGLLLAGAMILALAGAVFWPPPESGKQGSRLDALPLEGEPDALPPAAPVAGASTNNSASPSISPSSSSSSATRPSSPSPSPISSSATPSSSPSADDREDWLDERYGGAQEERETIREGALRERRKLNVKERGDYWAVEARLVDEIGVEAYDQLLYQDGRSNRSRVHWVASGSHAGQAGIQKGDIILSYGGEPVFAPRSVRETNRLFPPGGQVVVEVDRDGEILEFTLATDLRNRGRSGIVNGMTLLPFSVRP